MLLSTHNSTLLRGMLAGAVALAAASACSRSDRSDTGSRDTTQTGAVAPTDTQPSATPQPVPADTTMSDTSNKTQAPSSRIHSDSNAKSGKQGAAGYPGNAGDTSTHVRPTDSSATAVPSNDSTVGAAAPADTASTEIAGAAADTTTPEPTADSSAVSDTMPADHAMADSTPAAGYEPMARDTSTDLAQGDSVSQASVDTTEQTEADSTAIHAQADTTTGQAPTDVAIQSQADSVTVVGDSSSVDNPGPRAKEDTISSKADSLAQHHDADRVRPPEDSTEVLGNVTSDEDKAEVDQGNADQAAAAAAPVPSTGNIATGSDAVALMTRSGEQCSVVDPDNSRDVLWDLSNSPATMNPCGTGTMTLPKIWTGEKK
jgi:hypothetical protein